MSEAPRKSNYKPRGEVISNEGKLLTEAGTSPHMERQATQGKLHKSKKKKQRKKKTKNNKQRTKPQRKSTEESSAYSKRKRKKAKRYLCGKSIRRAARG